MLQNIRNQIDAVLEKDVDRRQFLILSAAAILAVFGITRIVSSINNASSTASKPAVKKGPYGSKIN